MKSRNANEISIKSQSRTGFTSQSRPESESESITESFVHVPSKSVSDVTIRIKSKSKKKNEHQPEADFVTESEPDLNELEISLKSNLNSERHSWCKESVTEYALVLYLKYKM